MYPFFFALMMSLGFSSTVFAAKSPCAGFAKYGAIRAYKAEVGTIQGSEGIEYSATLKKQSGDEFTYLVTISDNNEDGETWDVDYIVTTRKLGTGKCKVLSVQKQEPDEGLIDEP